MSARRWGVRACAVCFLAAALPLVAANLLPGKFGKYTAGDHAAPPALEPASVVAEYALEASDSAVYSGPQKLAVAAWRLKDSTAALAFFQWQRSQPGAWHQAGNYVLRFDGPKPRKDVLAALTAALPSSPSQPLPVLPGYLPERNLVPGSERYILGEASLRQFEARVSPELARFDMGAEAQFGRYKTPSGDVDLTIFSYPTPQIARLQLKLFEKIPGATARRSGPMVVVAFGSPGDAVPLAESVGYQASLTLNEATRDYSGNPGDMLIAIFQMIGYILLFCIGAGVLFAGIRRLQDYGFGRTRASEPMITLHLEDK